MKDTLVVNLFAGPGAGKSTGAAYIFSMLKMAGVDTEYVNEYAKDKVWEDNKEVFKCQFLISGKQAYKILRCVGKVDVVITDSPIAIGAQYSQDNPYLKDAVLYEFNKYKNLNIYINRVKKYNPNGRHQTEEEAKKIDESTKQWLKDNNINYIEVNGDINGYNEVVAIIKSGIGILDTAPKEDK